jgi:hypothetical protein
VILYSWTKLASKLRCGGEMAPTKKTYYKWSHLPLLLIRWPCLPSSFFFFFWGNKSIWLAYHSKKMKLQRLTKLEGSILKYRVPPLWPHLFRWKKDNICQSIWDKNEVLWRTCWGTHKELEEQIGNLIGPIENLKVTQWEHIRNQGFREKNSPHPPNLKGKKSKAPWVHSIEE